MYCPKCGFNLNDDNGVEVCPECGAKLRESTEKKEERAEAKTKKSGMRWRCFVAGFSFLKQGWERQRSRLNRLLKVVLNW